MTHPVKTVFFLTLTSGLLPLSLFGQTAGNISDSLSGLKVFQLGEVVITAAPSAGFGRVSAGEMNQQNKLEVSRALNLVPGISLMNSGSRNESMVTLRGFDLRAVPVYLDGIPVYVPYDGYVDLARFTTFDLSALDVSAGFSPLRFGPNSLGGVINLISARPEKALEYGFAAGLMSSGGYRSNLNLGSRWSYFYFQGGYSWLKRDNYSLSEDFKPVRHESGGSRENSWRKDTRTLLKLGWIPAEGHEYVVGYLNQQGEKGNPVYAGTDTKNSLLAKPRYWKWPVWDKETWYFLSGTPLNEDHSFKIKIYYDQFRNALDSYDDSTYSKMTKGYTFRSRYYDFSYGGNLDFFSRRIQNHHLILSAQVKEDVHREKNIGEPVRKIEDRTWYFSAEDEWQVSENWMLLPGISYSIRQNIEAQDYSGSTGLLSPFPAAKASKAAGGQVGVIYSLSPTDQLVFSVSRKTRFATTKDRYSYKMGTAIPNPVLKPESSVNYDLTWSGVLNSRLRFQSSLFYSHIENAILNVSLVPSGKFQMQNAGAAEFKGAEFSGTFGAAEGVVFGGSWSYTDRKNISSPSVRFTDVPRTKLTGWLQADWKDQIRFYGATEYNSARFSTSYGTRAPEFVLVNLSVSAGLFEMIRFEAGVNNVLDKNYALSEGYPEEGRNYFVTLRFSGGY